MGATACFSIVTRRRTEPGPRSACIIRVAPLSGGLEPGPRSGLLRQRHHLGRTGARWVRRRASAGSRLREDWSQMGAGGVLRHSDPVGRTEPGPRSGVRRQGDPVREDRRSAVGTRELILRHGGSSIVGTEKLFSRRNGVTRSVVGTEKRSVVGTRDTLIRWNGDIAQSLERRHYSVVGTQKRSVVGAEKCVVGGEAEFGDRGPRVAGVDIFVEDDEHDRAPRAAE